MLRYLIVEVSALIFYVITSITSIYAAKKLLNLAFKQKKLFAAWKFLLRLCSIILSLMLCVMALGGFWQVPKNIPNVIRLIHLSNSKKPTAYLTLGKYFLYGQYMHKNYTEARSCFKKAAKYKNPDALFLLGKIYGTGLGVDINPEKAYLYIHKAAKHNLPEAQTCLGRMYLEGRFVEPNTEKAKCYLKLAANQGSQLAVLLLKNLLTK